VFIRRVSGAAGRGRWVMCVGVALQVLTSVSALAQPAAAPAAAPETSRAGAPPATPAAVAPATVAPGAPSPLASGLSVSGGLTAADVGRRAAETSIDAEVRRQRVIAAKATRERVFWEAAPRLALTAQTLRQSEVDVPAFDFGAGTMTAFPAPPQTSHLLNARLTVPLSDYLLRTVRAVRGANANRDAALLEERAARVTAASNAKLAFYDWVRARLETVLAEQALSTANAQLERMRALFGVGRAAEADLLQAQAFAADAELALRAGETQVSIAEERLRVAIHAAPEERLSVGEDVLAPFPAGSEQASLDVLYREALEKRLELQALERSRNAVENVSAVEGTRALPKLEGFGSITHANPNPRVFPQQEQWDTTWEVGLALTWTVNDLGTAGTQATIYESQAAELAGQRKGVEDAVRVEVASALGALRQASVNVSTAEQGERAAVAAFAARERLQEQGMATTLELMQAETARIRARLNVINAHITLRIARVQLDHAVGRDVMAQER
jgi:outer membrane protein TolC